MKNNKLTIILLLSLVISLAGWNLWLIAWHNFYYQCDAIFIFLLFVVLKCVDVKEKYFNKVVNIGFWMSINTVIDELFFDPTKFTWNEYIFILIIIYITFRPNKKTRK